MNVTPLSIVYFQGWPIALKLEGHIPNNSHKSRPAAIVVERLRREGHLCSEGPPVTCVISSSGNAAFELAKHLAETNSVVVVFTDTLSPQEMRDRLRIWPQVRLEVVNEPDATGSHAAARKRRVREFLQRHPDAIEIDQYADPEWPCGYAQLLGEIERQIKNFGSIFLPVGTGATLRAAVRYKTQHGRQWQIHAVDAMGSALNGPPVGRRLFSGYGNGSPTEWVRQARSLVASWMPVADRDVVCAAYWLRQQGYFVGASSAAAFAAAASQVMAGRLAHEAMPVVMCPDHGSNYLSTLYNEVFLERHELLRFIHKPVTTK